MFANNYIFYKYKAVFNKDSYRTGLFFLDFGESFKTKYIFFFMKITPTYFRNKE